jgi:hypothetical protein
MNTIVIGTQRQFLGPGSFSTPSTICCTLSSPTAAFFFGGRTPPLIIQWNHVRPSSTSCWAQILCSSSSDAPRLSSSLFSGRTILLLYLDDMIIIRDDHEYIAFVKACLSEQFLMSDLTPLRYFLRIEIAYTPKGFFLSQEKYIHDLLSQVSLTDYRTTETSMELNVHLTPTNSESLKYPTCYRHIVGSLVYLDVTKSDISYYVHILRQFVSSPTQIHYSHLIRVLCVIFVGLFLFTCSFHDLALYNSKHIVMLLGPVIPLIVVLFLPIVFFFVVPLLLGRLRTK